jgi:predicted alpha-1,6-mannanase (GH76 family)
VTWVSRATAAAAALQRWYQPRSGLWESTGWWNAANALTALVDYISLSRDFSYRPVVAQTFDRAPGWRRHGFINEFYDDCAWWGLAWLGAFDLSAERRYLSAAEAIFRHMITGWDETFGGGVWWSRRRDYKNAITNELFGLLAARLYMRTERRSYLSWAHRCWEWFVASGMIGPSGLINDGLSPAGRNNGGTTWTYNQGVVLGLLADLYSATSDRSYLSAGLVTAGAALRSLTLDGILTEPGRGEPNRDLVQFKGIFARNLRAFAALAPVPGYREFTLANASSAWDRARNASDQFGYRWQGPFDRADAGRQSAALDLLNSAIGVAPEPAITESP